MRYARHALSTSAPRYTTQSQTHPFSFLPANSLDPKPRTKGLTEIRGPYYAPVTETYLNELLNDWGDYVDGIKFAGGAFTLMPEERLKGLIETAHKHSESCMIHALECGLLTQRTDCYVSTGGYIERVISASGGSKSTISKYLTTCKNLG